MPMPRKYRLTKAKSRELETMTQKAKASAPPKTVDVAIPSGQEAWAASRLDEYKKAKLDDRDALLSLKSEIDKPISAEEALRRLDYDSPKGPDTKVLKEMGVI